MFSIPIKTFRPSKNGTPKSKYSDDELVLVALGPPRSLNAALSPLLALNSESAFAMLNVSGLEVPFKPLLVTMNAVGEDGQYHPGLSVHSGMRAILESRK